MVLRELLAGLLNGVGLAVILTLAGGLILGDFRIGMVLGMAMIANLQYGWTLFVDPIDAKHQWGRAAIQTAFTIFVLTETWLVPVEAWFVDRYGPLPEAALRLVAVARLRLLCREYGVTEVTAISDSTIRLTPLTLLDSGQLRLKRMYPGATYRATTSTVQIPIPRAGAGVGAPRIRDLELARAVAGLLLVLDGKAAGEVDITDLGGSA